MNGKQKPMRKCVGCGEMKEKGALVRIVKTKEGDVSVDTTNRANGRGAYICKNKDCFRLAIKNKGLERALKGRLPEEILTQLEQEI